MTDFNKILDKAKELEAKMKENQQKIKEIRVESVSGSNSAKIFEYLFFVFSQFIHPTEIDLSEPQELHLITFL